MMKHINFINPLPTAQISSIKRWIMSSLFLGTCVLIALSVISGNKYWQLSALKQEKLRLHQNRLAFNAAMQTKQELKKQEQALQSQLNLIESASKQTQQHAILLASIKQTLKNFASLESYTLESTGIQLCIDCTQTQQATEIVSSLTKLPDIAGLHMNSLQPKQHGPTTALRLNLRGTIKPS